MIQVWVRIETRVSGADIEWVMWGMAENLSQAYAMLEDARRNYHNVDDHELVLVTTVTDLPRPEENSG